MIATWMRSSGSGASNVEFGCPFGSINNRRLSFDIISYKTYAYINNAHMQKWAKTERRNVKSQFIKAQGKALLVKYIPVCWEYLSFKKSLSDLTEKCTTKQYLQILNSGWEKGFVTLRFSSSVWAASCLKYSQTTSLLPVSNTVILSY